MLPIRDQNPTRRVPYLTYTLILLNILAFLASRGLSWAGVEGVGQALGVVPARFIEDPARDGITVLTSLFTHWDLAHLGGNLLFLYIFGDNIEDALGPFRYLLLYFASGVAGVAAHLIIYPTSQVPLGGASGAIAGLLGAYLVLYPRAKVLMLNLVPPLWLLVGLTFYAPAWLVLGFWFLFQNLMPALAQLVGVGSSDVAFFAHLGGFVVGLLAIRPLCIGRTPAHCEVWDGWRSLPRAAGQSKATLRSSHDP
ncbi:MAG: rhomboid family intramembrane serine protease [Polyangiaceae bacterium]|nr:rhomboid family intramembrane serine protease [Polyangiaceae bacterium]MCW5790195.1 rhomboid family intramembrane serine protease [Polyangiaceae bacterium]